LDRMAFAASPGGAYATVCHVAFSGLWLPYSPERTDRLRNVWAAFDLGCRIAGLTLAPIVRINRIECSFQVARKHYAACRCGYIRERWHGDFRFPARRARVFIKLFVFVSRLCC
jgi:hypothetical protein